MIDSPTDKNASLDDADRLLKAGRHEQAIDLLDSLLAVHPDEESVMLRLAWACWDIRDKDRSIFYWERLFDREIRRPVFTGFAFDELTRIYKEERRPDRLIELCRRAAITHPDDVGILTELGHACLLAGRLEEARDVFSRLTTLEADNPVFFCKLGQALMALELSDEAEAAFRRASQIDPDEADRYLFQAACLYQQCGKVTEAERLILECMALAPMQGLYDCALGDLLISRGNIPDALAAYEKAAHRAPQAAASYYHRLGHALMAAKRYSEAMQAFSREVSMEANPVSLRALADACEKAGEIDLADRIRNKL